MVKKLKFIISLDAYEEVTGNSVVDTDSGKQIFHCYNLDEYPEDAIIGRDLFDGNDFISAVKLGMELAKEGYIDLEVEEDKEE